MPELQTQDESADDREVRLTPVGIEFATICDSLSKITTMLAQTQRQIRRRDKKLEAMQAALKLLPDTARALMLEACRHDKGCGCWCGVHTTELF